MMSFGRRFVRSTEQSKDSGKKESTDAIRMLSRGERNALFALIILNISFQVSNTSRFENMCSDSGTDEISIPPFVMDLLEYLVKELDLSEAAIDAYLPMITPKEHSNLGIAQQLTITQPFKQGLAGLTYYQKLDLICRLMVFFISKSCYNGFTRSLLRQLCQNFEISSMDFVMVENLFCQYITSYLNAMADNAKNGAEGSNTLTEEQKRNKRMKRYLKIGAASVGAGALLAVTGGLAAPAIAGALVVMGTSTLAATVSVTTMAALFGGAGAGLTGYKMLKRTRGISEFEFEQYGEEGKMAVIISVSGWLNQKEDYKRSMGIVPNEMSPQERLFRFYSIHMPER
jgi:hypothetical protein